MLATYIPPAASLGFVLVVACGVQEDLDGSGWLLGWHIRLGWWIGAHSAGQALEL